MSESRKRRILKRLAIALALLVVPLYVAHWYFSRGIDQRFVGTWTVTAGKHGMVGWNYRFSPYGRGEVYHRNGKGVTFSWNVRGEILETWRSNNKQTFTTWINREREMLWGQVTTGQIRNNHSEILSIGPDEITYRAVEKDQQLTLRRISE